MKLAHLSMLDVVSKLSYKWVFCFWCVCWNAVPWYFKEFLCTAQKGANPSLVEVKLKTQKFMEFF